MSSIPNDQDAAIVIEACSENNDFIAQMFVYLYIYFLFIYLFFFLSTVYTRVSCDLVYHATLKILASKHYFIIYYEYHASCIFEKPDKIVLGRLGYDCRTR